MLFFTTALLASAPVALAHMNIFHPSMYGWKDLKANKLGSTDWVAPMANLPYSQWWMRGYGNRATGGQIMALPAGGKVTIEHACHLDFTSYAPTKGTITKPGSTNDACPNSPGAYHLGDGQIVPKGASGCALAIADVDHPSKANQNNMVVFSTNQSCIQQKMTSYSIPALMPACTGKKCICAWLWTANEGTANFYMSGFDCKITNVSKKALKIGKPQTPKWAGGPGWQKTTNVQPSKAVKGPKTPFYLYNNDIQKNRQTPWCGNWWRAGYHASWSFPINGAQTDIFVKTKSNTKSSSKRYTRKTTKKIKNTSHRSRE